MSQFTCFKCKNTYDKRNDEEWNDYLATKELLDLYPETKNDPTDVICDDCNEEFKIWFAAFIEEEKKKMRDDYMKVNK